MTSKPAPSLRRTLLINLLLPISALGVVLLLAGLVLIDRTIETAYDRVLNGSVKAIAENITVEDGEIVVDLPQVALGMLETDAHDSIYYRVTYDRALVTGYKDLPVVDMTNAAPGSIAHFSLEYRGAPIRLAVMTQQAYGKPLPVVVEVAETTNGRGAARRELLFVLAALEIGIISAATLLVLFAVRRGLSPLAELEREIDALQLDISTSLKPLSLANIPSEVHAPIRAMNELFVRLAAAVEIIRNFTGDASHQMKTPLASLRVHLALLQRNSWRSMDDADSLAQIEQSTRHLDRLVGQLLALARAEQTAVADIDADAESEFSDLVVSTRDAVRAMVSFAAIRNIDLIFDAEIETARVRARSSVLHDVLTNLIDNGIRYNSEEGSVTAKVFADGGQYCVMISDTGSGIAPKYRDRIFDRFYRVPGPNRPSGSGLGLSIVKTLLERSGGTIALTDGPNGRGLSVTIGFAAENGTA